MKVKRNDPCPCGSELKYKKCCINNNTIDTNNRPSQDMSFPDFPTQFIGYSRDDVSPFSDEIDDYVVCMINEVTIKMMNQLEQDNIDGYKIGEYVITSGSCGKIKFYPSQPTVEKAFDYAHSIHHHCYLHM